MAPVPASSPFVIFETRDAGGLLVTDFGIKQGQEREAGLQVLDHLRSGEEAWLRNDLDEGGEGCTQFRIHAGQFQTAAFGHGWSGRWKAIDDQEIIVAIMKLAELNRAIRESDRGSFRRPKTRSIE